MKIKYIKENFFDDPDNIDYDSSTAIQQTIEDSSKEAYSKIIKERVIEVFKSVSKIAPKVTSSDKCGLTFPVINDVRQTWEEFKLGNAFTPVLSPDNYENFLSREISHKFDYIGTNVRILVMEVGIQPDVIEKYSDSLFDVQLVNYDKNSKSMTIKLNWNVPDDNDDLVTFNLPWQRNYSPIVFDKTYKTLRNIHSELQDLIQDDGVPLTNLNIDLCCENIPFFSYENVISYEHLAKNYWDYIKFVTDTNYTDILNAITTAKREQPFAREFISTSPSVNYLDSIVDDIKCMNSDLNNPIMYSTWYYNIFYPNQESEWRQFCQYRTIRERKMYQGNSYYGRVDGFGTDFSKGIR